MNTVMNTPHTAAGSLIARVTAAALLIAAGASLAACNRDRYDRTPATLAPAPDPQLLGRFRTEFPVGAARDDVRARAEEMGMVRRPMLTTRSMKDGMPVLEEVEGLDLDIFAIGNGAAAGLAQGSNVEYIAFLFTEDGRLQDILLDFPPPQWNSPPEGVTFGMAATGAAETTR